MMEEAYASIYGKTFIFFGNEYDVGTAFKPNSVIPNLSVYEGEYEDKEMERLLLKVKMAKAILSLLPSKKQFTGTLSYVNRDTLRIVFNDKFVPTGENIFDTGKNGKPVSFRLDINSSDFLFKYLDFKTLIDYSIDKRRTHNRRICNSRV